MSGCGGDDDDAVTFDATYECEQELACAREDDPSTELTVEGISFEACISEIEDIYANWPPERKTAKDRKFAKCRSFRSCDYWDCIQ
jgi:hypothetical protein